LLICENNWCENPYFTDGFDHWDVSNAPSATIVEDSDAYDMYMCHVTYTASNEPVDYKISLTQSALNRSFIVSLRVRSVYNTFKISFLSYDEATDQYYQFGNWVFGTTNSNGTPERVTVAATVDQVKGDGKDLRMRIFPHYELPISQGQDIPFGDEDPFGVGELWDPDDADIYFDDVYISEVTGDFTFPQPNESKLTFEESIIGENKLWSGMVQKFNRRFSPLWEAEFDFLDVEYETYRQRLGESSAVFCMPHNDVGWGFLGYWKDDYVREYPFGRFMGHKGPIVIDGQEYFINKPEFKVNEGYIYVEEDLIIM
jgi:hypothetical protein